jgi:hypothetical protein
MSLQNLLGISLEQITPQKETIVRLLDGAARHIADAKVKAISAETRFSSAYTAIRMLADEYTGDIIPESAVAECLSQAESLHIVTLNWLREYQAGLV